MRSIFVLTFLSCFLLVEVTLAQSFYNRRYDREFILSVGTGVTSYFGELNNPGDYFDSRPNFNVGLQHFISDNVSIRSELSWFQLQGDDAKADDQGRKERNLSFKSDNIELNAVAMFNLMRKGPRYYQRNKFNAYGFIGVGLLYFNPKAEYNNNTYSLRQYTTEGVKYSAVTAVIPMGVGAKFMAGPFFNIGIEAGYRKTFTDYLDDVSSVYRSFNDIPNPDPIEYALSDRRPEIGLDRKPPGAIRGNPDKKDGYFMLNLKIEYYMPHGVFAKKKSAKKYKRPKRRR